MNESLQDKQLFLRSEILEAGIDPSVFLQFLISTNPHKGQDLDKWSLEQLRAIVEVFKENMQSPPRQQQVIVEQDSPTTKGFKEGAFVDDALYMDSVACEKKMASNIMREEGRVALTGFQKISGGVFGRDYVMYTVELSARSLVVKRRYSDFSWLRDAFMALHPGYPVPPIAKKKNRVRYDDKYLYKKMYILEKFLNKVLTIEELATDEIFQRFLTITDPKQFEKYKSRYAKIKEEPIHQIQTMSGKIEVTTEAAVLARISKLEEYFKVTQPETKKVYKNFKGVATCLEQASQYLEQVAGNCNFLKEKEDALRNILEFQPLGDTNPLNCLATFAANYSKQMLAQAQTFRKQIYSLMKYESFYKINMTQCLEALKVKQKEYETAKAALLKRKDKAYGQKVEKWNVAVKLNAKPPKDEAYPLLLPKQTEVLLKQRENYGLYCSQLYQECHRHVKDNQNFMCGYLTEFLQLQEHNSIQTAEVTQNASKLLAKIDLMLREL